VLTVRDAPQHYAAVMRAPAEAAALV